jgi:hypothetical protein
MIARIRRCFGPSSVIEIKKPLAIGLHHSSSLTTNGAAAFDEHRHSPVRLKYWEAWVDWHRTNALSSPDALFMPFPLQERPFEAPSEILPAFSWEETE